MNANKVIAHLCHRFIAAGNNEDNLAWSIVSKLKGKDYLSDYDPLRDAEVIEELNKIR